MMQDFGCVIETKWPGVHLVIFPGLQTKDKGFIRSRVNA